MKAVAIKELKNRLSAYFRVLVTDRGRVVAELSQDAHAYRPSPIRTPVSTADLLAAERGEQ